MIEEFKDNHGYKIPRPEKAGRLTLYSERNPITPSRVVVHETLENSRGDELAYAPTEIDVRGQIPSDREGGDLGGVRGPRRGKDAPGDAAEEGPHEQDLDRGREEDDEDEAGQPEE